MDLIMRRWNNMYLMNTCPEDVIVLNTTEPAECPHPEKVRDGVCDGPNNYVACDWDGGDCCTFFVDRSNCDKDTCVCHKTLQIHNQPTDQNCLGVDLHTLQDGICQDENNVQDCFFDAGDCCLMPLNDSQCTDCICKQFGIKMPTDAAERLSFRSEHPELWPSREFDTNMKTFFPDTVSDWALGLHDTNLGDMTMEEIAGGKLWMSNNVGTTKKAFFNNFYECIGHFNNAEYPLFAKVCCFYYRYADSKCYLPGDVDCTCTYDGILKPIETG